jgi:hypothetical protein
MRLLHYTRGHVVPEDPRTELETTSQAWFERDRKCSNKACFLQQDINRKKREEHLYKRDHKKLPEALIWYGCGIFHLRLLLIEKYDLWTYPVECDNSPRAKSLIQFFLKKKEQGKMAAIVIMGIPVPWLQVHQSMRALRYGHQYGKLTLNCVGWYSSSLNEGFDSEARLIEGRLLVRVRQFQTLGYFATQELSRRKDENLEFNCPHARELFYSNQNLKLEKLEAYKRVCVENETAGFVHKRFLCKRCRTETVIEVIRREDFESEKQMAPSSYFICQS